MRAALRLLLAAALAFASAASAQPTISADPALRAPNTSTQATWSLPAGSGWDNIELHAVGSSTVIAWQYTGGAASGSLWFWIPTSVQHGTYELWLIRSGYGHVATSNPITVSMIVSGQVTEGGSPLPGVAFTATNGAGPCTQSNATGHWSCAITSGWSGDVIPSKVGYVFTPASRNYVNVTSTQLGQNFSATPTVLVSGTASLNGLPLANVAFSASGGWSCTTSNAAGAYSCAVPTGWTGTITPSQTGYSFSPSSRNYSTAVVANDPGEDYSASLSSPTSNIAFIHVDHLSTPREIYNASQQLVWRKPHQEPFSDSPPDENPSGLGVFKFPLRESNYYFDDETGNAYAMYRDCYVSGIGRFCQSDPIGLEGGINTYAYVANNPLSYVDRLGLSPFSDTFKELFFEFFFSEAAKAMSAASQFGLAVGVKICKATGGNIPDPFTTCGADCAKYNTPAAGPAAYDLFEVCVTACQDEIKKCKAKPAPVSLACR